MGGCASKPKELKAEGEAPVPLDEPSTVCDPACGEAEQPDSSRRRSLGDFFKEIDESMGLLETDEKAAKDTTTLTTVEPMGEAEKSNAHVHPAEVSETVVAISVEESVDSSLKAEAQDVEVQASSLGPSVVEEKKTDTQVPAT